MNTTRILLFVVALVTVTGCKKGAAKWYDCYEGKPLVTSCEYRGNTVVSEAALWSSGEPDRRDVLKFSSDGDLLSVEYDGADYLGIDGRIDMICSYQPTCPEDVHRGNIHRCPDPFCFYPPP